MKIFVSIIMPAFNAEAYISETIESVQKQTYINWELLVIDDCSTDHTRQIVADFAKKDNRIKIIKQQYNGGVASARNAGLAKASGNYIAFLDSDDKWLPNKLNTQLSFMQKNKCVFCYSQYQNFASDSGKLGRVVRVPCKMTARDILGNTAIGCLTVLINKSAVGDFRMPLLEHTEDNVTWYEILKRGFTAYGIQETLAYYRVGQSSLTSNKKRAAMQQWEVYRNYFGFSKIKSLFYFCLYSVNAIRKHFL